MLVGKCGLECEPKYVRQCLLGIHCGVTTCALQSVPVMHSSPMLWSHYTMQHGWAVPDTPGINYAFDFDLIWLLCIQKTWIFCSVPVQLHDLSWDRGLQFKKQGHGWTRWSLWNCWAHGVGVIGHELVVRWVETRGWEDGDELDGRRHRNFEECLGD